MRALDIKHRHRTASRRDKYVKLKLKAKYRGDDCKASADERRAHFALYTIKDALKTWSHRLDEADEREGECLIELKKLNNEMKNAEKESHERIIKKLSRKLNEANDRLNSAKLDFVWAEAPQRQLAQLDTLMESEYKKAKFISVIHEVPLKKIDELTTCNLNEAIVSKMEEALSAAHEALKMLKGHEEVVTRVRETGKELLKRG